jgi:hypothetical protein
LNISLDLYIASDDRAVIVEAMNGGFMTSPIGISQEVANSGVFSALNSRGHSDSMGYNATLEIITVRIAIVVFCIILRKLYDGFLFRISITYLNAAH